MSQKRPNRLTRSEFLRAATGSVAAATAATSLVGIPAPVAEAEPPAQGAAASLLGELDEKIQTGMRKYGIPGVAMGMIHGGTTYVKGYGVTNVDYPTPVNGDTVFRIASGTKPATGTAAMRLVESGKLDLDARVREYLPDFATSRPSVARRVTVRQLLNHSAGWLGDYHEDMGPGDDALERYVEGMAQIPQLTPPGEVFQYNNAAIVLAGRVIAAVTGATYEEAIRELVLDPLRMNHSRFFSDEIIGFNVAAPHDVVDGEPVVEGSFWALPRSLNPCASLISSVRDQLRFARFHLGDGRASDGTRLLEKESLVAMRSNPGPGGTLVVELDGMGVTWMLRPSREGVRIVEHGGDVEGQYSGFLMVPEEGFAFTVLTNSEGGLRLKKELFVDDWVLKRFAGVSNLPAEPLALSRSELAPYEGHYTAQEIHYDGSLRRTEYELEADNGQLLVTQGQGKFRLVFYREDYVFPAAESGERGVGRADFVRGPNGSVRWLRLGGRLYRHQDL